MHYWDSSALVKLYAPEEDSSYFAALIAGSPVTTSSIALAEVLCTLNRKLVRAEIRSSRPIEEFQLDCQINRIVLVPFTETVAGNLRWVVQLAYSQPRPIMIRALDAIHVASAVTAGADAMIATDLRVRQLAALAQISVLP